MRIALTVATIASITAGSFSISDKAEARCYGCWAGAGIAAGLIGGAIIANNAYGYGGYYGYGYRPYYGGYYAPYAPAYSYYAPGYYYGGYAPGYYRRAYYPRRYYGYGYGYRPYYRRAYVRHW